MGKVTTLLLDLLARQVQDHGVVVWYDPDKQYLEVAVGDTLAGVPLLRYEGSYLELREKLEPYLEYVVPGDRIDPDKLEPRPVIVYVPLARRDSHHALVEAEAYGTVIEPEGPWQKNTRLRGLAERAFKTVAPDRVTDIGRQVDAGTLTLADLDELAEQAGAVGIGALKLIFKSGSPAEIALSFLASDAQDAALEAKRAVPELSGLLRTEFGLPLDPTGAPPAVRAAARRSVLLADLLSSLPEGTKVPSLDAAPVPQQTGKRARCRELCSAWRNRADLREAYADAARTVEREFGLAELKLSADALVSAETFPFIEQTLIGTAEERLLADDAAGACGLAARRKAGFWPREDGANGLRWAILESAATVLREADRVRAALRQPRKDPVGMIRAYATGSEPWMRLDTAHRHLERQYSTFETGLAGEHERLERVVAHARHAYQEAVGACAVAFSAALEASDFSLPGLLRQREVFGKFVAPRTGTGKLAYVLVDALRYEMAAELFARITDGTEVKLEPAVAEVPTITDVGMAALLPGADKDFELAEDRGELLVKVAGRALRDRAARVKVFREHFGERFTELKLNDLTKPSSKTKEAVQKADVILVTSQEIDRRGEESADEETPRHMAEVLDKLRLGLRRLAGLGVTECVLTADHGHLYVQREGGGLKLNPPGGRTVLLDRRAWVGQGGAADPGVVRVPAAKLGLSGGLELAFPRGLGYFVTDDYFHSGMSLQELIIPVAVVRFTTPAATGANGGKVEVRTDRARVTNRFFSVGVSYRKTGIFDPPERRVRVVARSGRKDVGEAVAAGYGFSDGPREVVLRPDEMNVVTLLLSESGVPSATVHVLDADSGAELARTDALPVAIHF